MIVCFCGNEVLGNSRETKRKAWAPESSRGEKICSVYVLGTYTYVILCLEIRLLMSATSNFWKRAGSRRTLSVKMNAVGNMLVYSLAMIVLPVGGFFSSKAILFESKF